MLYMVLAAIIAVFVAILALQNSMMVDLRFVAWEFRMNMVLVVLIAALCGFLMATLWGLKVKAKGFLRERKLHDQISETEDECRILREKVAQYMAVLQKNGIELPSDKKAEEDGKTIADHAGNVFKKLTGN